VRARANSGPSTPEGTSESAQGNGELGAAGTFRAHANLRAVASAPQYLTLRTHRDRANWWQSVWIRRGLLLVPAAIVVLGLLNTFGQRPATSSARGSSAKLTVYAPLRARSGLEYAARFRIDATSDLKHAALLLSPGWAEGYTVNGLAPQPLTQGSTNGRLNFGFGHIPAGSHLTFWLSLQVNPTNVGHRAQDVGLYDGARLIAVVHRDITIFP
jgi:hypothetical protein